MSECDNYSRSSLCLVQHKKMLEYKYFQTLIFLRRIEGKLSQQSNVEQVKFLELTHQRSTRRQIQSFYDMRLTESCKYQDSNLYLFESCFHLVSEQYSLQKTKAIDLE